MVKADGAYGIESTQVVLVRCVIAVPRHHVERRVVDGSTPQVAVQLCDQLEITLFILVPGVRREEVSRVRKTVRPNGTQVWQFGAARQNSRICSRVPNRPAV